MSMISPEAFIKIECKGKTYKELLMIREELLESIYGFEKGRISEEARMISPSPEVIYQMDLEYLGLLCKLIAETYAATKEDPEGI